MPLTDQSHECPDELEQMRIPIHWFGTNIEVICATESVAPSLIKSICIQFEYLCDVHVRLYESLGRLRWLTGSLCYQVIKQYSTCINVALVRVVR